MSRKVPLAAYDTLGVSPCDDFATIRRAWRGHVRALHPDRCAEPADAAARLATINDAYDALRWHRKLDATEEAAWRRAAGRAASGARRAPDAPRAPASQAAQPQGRAIAPTPDLPGAPAEADAFRRACALLHGTAGATTLRYA
jgi:hypothetical protein